MRDLHAARTGTDSERLADRIVDMVGLVAHVRHVWRVETSSHAGYLGDLTGRCVHPWGVDKSGGEAERALFEGLGGQPHHEREFVVGGWAVVEAHGRAAQRAVPE